MKGPPYVSSKTHKQIVLLIESDERVIREWRMCLESFGFMCLVANSSVEAHKLFCSNLSAVVVGLEGPDRATICLERKIRRCNIPVICYARKRKCGSLAHMLSMCSEIVLSKDEVPGLVMLAVLRDQNTRREADLVREIQARITAWYGQPVAALP
jgi:hypothetical protein